MNELQIEIGSKQICDSKDWIVEYLLETLQTWDIKIITQINIFFRRYNNIHNTNFSFKDIIDIYSWNFEELPKNFNVIKFKKIFELYLSETWINIHYIQHWFSIKYETLSSLNFILTKENNWVDTTPITKLNEAIKWFIGSINSNIQLLINNWNIQENNIPESIEKKGKWTIVSNWYNLSKNRWVSWVKNKQPNEQERIVKKLNPTFEEFNINVTSDDSIIKSLLKLDNRELQLFLNKLHDVIVERNMGKWWKTIILILTNFFAGSYLNNRNFINTRQNITNIFTWTRPRESFYLDKINLIKKIILTEYISKGQKESLEEPTGDKNTSITIDEENLDVPTEDEADIEIPVTQVEIEEDDLFTPKLDKSKKPPVSDIDKKNLSNEVNRVKLENWEAGLEDEINKYIDEINVILKKEKKEKADFIRFLNFAINIKWIITYWKSWNEKKGDFEFLSGHFTSTRGITPNVIENLGELMHQTNRFKNIFSIISGPQFHVLITKFLWENVEIWKILLEKWKKINTNKKINISNIKGFVVSDWITVNRNRNPIFIGCTNEYWEEFVKEVDDYNKGKEWAKPIKELLGIRSIEKF